MEVVYFCLYFGAGICFGLAAGGASLPLGSRGRVLDFVAFGLLLWVVVEFIKSVQRL